MTDPRSPVIVAASQVNEHDLDGEPIASLIGVADAALAASGARDALVRHLGSVRVLQGLWSYRDPGRLVADALGLGPVQTTLSPIGGNEVYDLVNTTAADIRDGRLDAAVLCSSEVGRTTRRLRRRGERVARYPEPDGTAPDRTFGSSEAMQEDRQAAVGAHIPAAFYAMVESAIRHRRGESVPEHLHRIAALWATASEVASRNPFAAVQRVVTADDIATDSAGNRRIASPYTKLMTANIDVDMAAAVVMCSLGTARAMGLTDDRLVFVAAGAGASDHWSVSERWAFDESPAMRATGLRALALAGRSLDEIDDLDLYSCFPSAVQLAQDHLGVDPRRPFTITGGLTFCGGPLNSYCLHALATAYDRISHGRATSALLTGNGGYFTKHSCTVLTADAPPAGYRTERPQDEVDAGPRRPRPGGTPSTATLETCTVTYDRDGLPATAIATALDDDGARHWATSSRADVIDALLSADHVGEAVHLTVNPDDSIEVWNIT